MLAIFACITFPSLVVAQDYRPGYIIKNNRDSVSGFIIYNSGKKNSALCVFKETRKSGSLTYMADNLHSYGYYGDKQYLSVNLPDKSRTGKVFVKVLAKGAISLYRYNNSYIVQKDSLIVLPPPKAKQIETSAGLMAQNDRRYRGVLNYLISECQMTSDQTEYAEDDLTSLINNYNRCKGQEPLYKKPRPMAKLNYQAFAGYVQSNLKMDLFNGVSFNPSYTVIGGLGADISSPRIFDRIFISLEGWYVKAFYQAYTEGPYNGSIRRQDIFMDVSYFKLPVGIRYNFLSENNTPYIKAGFSTGFHHQTTTKTLVEKEEPNQKIMSEETTGGYELRRPAGVWLSIGYDKSIFRKLRVFAEFRYERGDGFIGSPVQSISTLTGYNFLLGIRF